MLKEIVKCRICGNSDLVQVLDLGSQYLTGVFPKSRDEVITSGPLELVKCSAGAGCCGLLQLRHSYDLKEMYGQNYGYRSGLNLSMVRHLHEKVRKILEMVDLAPGDIVIDIGSNDSTLLQGYPEGKATLVGIDPTGRKFMDYYPPHIILIPDFFSSSCVKDRFGGKKAKIVTSIAMFYDLEDPTNFMEQIHDVLDDNGIWVFEQSYMPTMLEMNAYDTVCHEHLEYYGLKQIKWMTDRAGLKIIDVELNNVNGGSFSVTASKAGSSFPEATELLQKMLLEEERLGLDTLAPYDAFRDRVYRHREELAGFISQVESGGKKVLGYGASTKGNVILQFCGLTPREVPFIAEVNRDKFGCYTPGTLIPIISEEEARGMRPDYFMILPWHFRPGIIDRERAYLESGGKLFFPLPRLEVVEK